MSHCAYSGCNYPEAECNGACMTIADARNEQRCTVCHRRKSAATACDWQQGRCPHLQSSLALYHASVADKRWATHKAPAYGYRAPRQVRNAVRFARATWEMVKEFGRYMMGARP